jgi:hypothetical protein
VTVSRFCFDFQSLKLGEAATLGSQSIRISMSKPKLRARMAPLSFSEKIKILENLGTGKKQSPAAGSRKLPKKPCP